MPGNPNSVEEGVAGAQQELSIRVDDALNDYGEALRWMACWLLPDVEGDIIGMGLGGGAARGRVPGGVVGYRLRRWFSDGVAPEYEDHRFDQSSENTTPVH